MKPALFEKSYLLTAGETDAQGRMPVTLVAAQAIEIATLHADALGIGYSQLAEHHLGWVLARISIEMIRYPQINETYKLSTWIEGYNRFFSDRCFEMTDAEGNTIANIRSVWVAIDVEKRKMADISQLERGSFPILERTCPVDKCGALAIAKDTDVKIDNYTFNYCDIDFNRHVNTVRYINAVLNLQSLDFYDRHIIRRIEASFEHESYYGDHVELRTGASQRNPDAITTEIISPSGKRSVAIEIVFENLI